MKDNLYNILANTNKDIDNQKLLDYISGKLSNQDRHEVEKLMADSEFMNDAIEGLEKVADTHNLNNYIEQLNKGLKNQIQNIKMRREKRRFKEYPWIYFTIILILLLCLLGFFVIRQYLRP